MANRMKFGLPDRGHETPWNPEKALAIALAEKMEFLNRYPKYLEFQKEIDRLLDKAGNPENRMTVLAMLLEGKLIDLHQQLQKLNKLLLKSGAKPDVDRHSITNSNLSRISYN
ncbi:MAG: hypothetical protein PVJ84_01765 [Desulfobacteraceae bacterium]